MSSLAPLLRTHPATEDLLQRREKLGAGTFVVRDFLSGVECQALIEASEAIGYEQALINTDQGETRLEEHRNNDRVIFDDTGLSAAVAQRLEGLAAGHVRGWNACGLNERWRFYRYASSQQFDWHYDGSFQRSPTERSLQTLLLYLNDGFEGGITEFGWDKVRPETGMALVFPHELRHRGAPVLSGCKYVLRTDLMFRQEAA